MTGQPFTMNTDELVPPVPKVKKLEHERLINSQPTKVGGLLGSFTVSWQTVID